MNEPGKGVRRRLGRARELFMYIVYTPVCLFKKDKVLTIQDTFKPKL